MERKEGKGSTTGDFSPLRVSSDASTPLNSPSPERPSFFPGKRDSAEGRQAVGMNSTRVRRRALRDRRRGDGGLEGVGVEASGIRTNLLNPTLVMKVSALFTSSGSICVLLAVFSGPVLVFLAVLTLGICGMCYSIRQRGALEYLPSGIVDILTRTTLLEFLTDTTVFDAIKTYLVFMMGLSAEETERVLHSLPEDMRDTLTRPGLMHTLPRPLQGILLPLDQSASSGRWAASEPSTASEARDAELRGRRGLLGEEGAENLHGGANSVPSRAAVPELDDEERASPLGQLVWNPFPLPNAREMPLLLESDKTRDAQRMPLIQPAEVGGTGREGRGGEPEEKADGDEVEEQGNVSDDVHDRGDVGEAVGQNRGAGGSNRRQPWVRSPPQSSHSLSPANARRGTSACAPSNENHASTRAHLPRGATSASPESRVVGWSAGNPERDFGGSSSGPSPSASGLVPSAERIVASILQSRVDKALSSVWNLVDERSVSRAALGSGIAFAAHVALSERARRQATMMLRGGLLAGLAGTATVCAFLSYLKRGEASAAPTGEIPRGTVGDAREATTAAVTSDWEERTEGAEGSATRHSEGGGIRKPLRLLYQRLIAKTPSTRNLLRLLGMICILLAIRKWQSVRRLANRAIRASIMYGMPPP